MKNTTYYNLIPTSTRLAYLALAAVLALSIASPAVGLTRIQDIARPLGERTNQLIGTGIVVGLAGTGDSADSLLTNRPLASLLQNLHNMRMDTRFPPGKIKQTNLTPNLLKQQLRLSQRQSRELRLA